MVLEAWAEKSENILLVFVKNWGQIPSEITWPVTSTRQSQDNWQKMQFPPKLSVLRQGLLNRWTSQLDLGNTAGWLERAVSVHNST